MTAFLILATLFLAYANGANDNFKGVATLYGSGTTSYRRALIFATLAALAGSAAAVFLGSGLAAAFGGKGLVPDELARSGAFAGSVALGAALTVILATVVGLPVSTTHALTGALVGAGFIAVGTKVNLGTLGKAFFLPLLASPVAALAMAGVLYPALRFVRLRLGLVEETCVCIGPERVLVPVPVEGRALPVATLGVTVADEATCVKRYGGKVLGVSAQTTLDALHVGTAGVVCFARALNDTPKMVGLLALSGAVSAKPALLLAGAAVAVGGLFHSRRIAETMGTKAATLNAGSGFTANLVTSGLVLTASFVSLPVSTTHVSVGGITGIGVANGTARWKTLGGILLAWVTTLPLAAVLAGVAYKVIA